MLAQVHFLDKTLEAEKIRTDTWNYIKGSAQHSRWSSLSYLQNETAQIGLNEMEFTGFLNTWSLELFGKD